MELSQPQRDNEDELKCVSSCQIIEILRLNFNYPMTTLSALEVDQYSPFLTITTRKF